MMEDRSPPEPRSVPLPEDAGTSTALRAAELVRGGAEVRWSLQLLNVLDLLKIIGAFQGSRPHFQTIRP